MSTKNERANVYATQRWAALRLEALRRDGQLCADCAAQGRTNGAELVHHVKPIRDGGDPWALENIKSLCRDCHQVEHAPPGIPGQAEWQGLVTQTMKENCYA